jgi:Zn-dependent protease with chaperone function
MPLAFLSQSILHAVVAAVFVETLLRAWRIEDGAWRLRFRLLALTAPILWLPALWVVAPIRRNPVFVANWALFAGERWNEIRLGGTGLGDLLLLLACGAGSALFLRDALPPLIDAVRGATRPLASGPWHPTTAGLRGLVAARSSALAIPPPAVRLVDTPTPVLLCEGAREPVLVISPAAIERLGPAELDAAITHELAHARHRDPAWGYCLIAARAALFFNPAAQWIARAMVDDIERRADQTAAAATGHPEGLARAIERLSETAHPPPVDGHASFERVFWRIRQEGLARRCARLRHAPGPGRVRASRALVAAAALGIFALVFFVV